MLSQLLELLETLSRTLWYQLVSYWQQNLCGTDWNIEPGCIDSRLAVIRL